MPLSMIRALTVAVLVLLTGCEVDETETLAPGAFGPDLAARAEAACLADGGRWGTGGISGAFVCYRDMSDANKPCANAGDCDGHCLARSRSCSPVQPLFGCHDVLNRLGVETTLCLE